MYTFIVGEVTYEVVSFSIILQPWTDTSREDSKGSEPDSWDMSEAPIARLESLDEIDRAQVQMVSLKYTFCLLL